MAKKKRALVEVEFNCPICEAKLRAVIYRKRLNPTEPGIYEVTSDVEAIKQEELFPEEDKKHKVKGKGKKASITAN